MVRCVDMIKCQLAVSVFCFCWALLCPRPATGDDVFASLSQQQRKENELASAIRIGLKFDQDLDALEAKLNALNLTVARDSSEAHHFSFFGHDEDVQHIGRQALIALKVSETIIATRKLTRGDLMKDDEFLKSYDLRKTELKGMCSQTSASCGGVNRRYRTADGTCNNIKYPAYGMAKSNFWREVPNCYDDGHQTPRTRGKGLSKLPNARKLSYSVFPDGDFPDGDCSLLFMQFGQFLDHDMTLSGVTRGAAGSGLTCCHEIYTASPELLHPECFAIDIAKDDPFYSQYGYCCMNFVRSTATPSPACYLSSREQINQLTAYIDASQIYGNDQARQGRIRAYAGGALRVHMMFNAPYLPLNEENQDPNDCALPATSDEKCFLAGDVRANEVVHTTVLQTLFMREHNRIACILSEYNPRWRDEKIFQEARRIVAAVFQHITYNEFLPKLLGVNVMKQYNLILKRRGYLYAYNESQDASIGLAFATAAFRLHSLIQGTCKLNYPTYAENFNLSNVYNCPVHLYASAGLDCLIRGLCNNPMQTQDRYITTEVTQNLFRPPGALFGLDLYAIDIQRGRDHGLCGYTTYRRYCGLSPVSSFGDLNGIMAEESISMLQSQYKSVEDIDLIIGGHLEYKIEGAATGETFACIIAHTFNRLRFGDRFWYENEMEETAFTPDQLQQIRKVTLARIICDNSNGITSMQPQAMFIPTNANPKVACSDSLLIARMSLLYWKE